MNVSVEVNHSNIPYEGMRQTIFDSTSKIACALIDKDNRIVGATRGFTELFGCDPERVIGQTVIEAFGINETGAGAAAINVTGTHLEQGAERRLDWSIEPISGGQYCIGLLRDVSALEKCERQLMHCERLATLGSLTSALLHEIAAPLTVIANNAELLLDEEIAVDRESKRSITLIRDEAFRLGALLNDFLRFVRDAPLAVTAQDAASLVERSIGMFERRTHCKKVALRVEAEPGLPPIAGDAERLHQVFFNLISNACDASPEDGEVIITVNRAETVLEGNRAAIECVVADHGPGIAADDLEHVFDLYFSTKPAGEGTGLGLPIARRIVTAHGGELYLRSSPQGGTRATVRLPIWEPPPSGTCN